MHLLTKNLLETLPSLRSQENSPNEQKIVYAKFFFSLCQWTWFVMEGEKKARDFHFFGYIIGADEKFGHFTLSELESIQIAGLTTERDLYFQPGEFRYVIEKFRDDRRL